MRSVRFASLVLFSTISASCGCVAGPPHGLVSRPVQVRARETTDYSFSLLPPKGHPQERSGVLDFFALYLEEPEEEGALGSMIVRTYKEGWIDTPNGRFRFDGAVIRFMQDASGRRTLQRPDEAPEHLRSTLRDRLGTHDIRQILQGKEAASSEASRPSSQTVVLTKPELALLVGVPEAEIESVRQANLERLTSTRWTIRFSFGRHNLPPYDALYSFTEPVDYVGTIDVQSGGRGRMRVSFDYTRVAIGVAKENASIEARLHFHIHGYAELWTITGE